MTGTGPETALRRAQLEAALAARPLAELGVPAELNLSRRAPLQAAWIGGGRVLIAARDRFSQQPVLAVLRAGRGWRLWQADPGPDIPDADRAAAAELTVLPGGQALALITGGALLAVAADGQSLRRIPLPRPQNLPGTAAGTGAAAILRSKSGRLSIARIAADAVPEKTGWDLRQALHLRGPVNGAGQRISQLATDGSGRLIACVDDPAEGFAIWCRENDQWRAVLTGGAARFGMNAAVHALCRWQGRWILAVGSDAGLADDMPQLALAGELLQFDEDGFGTAGLLCGEMRISARQLLVPSLPPSHPLMQARVATAVNFIGLFPWRDDAGSEGLVIQLYDPRAARHALYHLTPDHGGFWLPLSGDLAGVAQGPEGPIAMIWQD
jgi:hypothetical protein